MKKQFEISVVGDYAGSPCEDFERIVVEKKIKITDISIEINNAEPAGSLDVGLMAFRNQSNWSSLLACNLSYNYFGKDFCAHTVMVDHNNAELSPGDEIRLDLLNTETDGRSFKVLIQYEET